MLHCDWLKYPLFRKVRRDLEQEYIPFFPRGWPFSAAFCEYLNEVLVHAKIDTARAIEPSLTLEERQFEARPPDHILLRRFTDRAIRWIGRLVGRTQIVIILPWRMGEDQQLCLYLNELSSKLPKIPKGREARFVLLIEGMLAEGDLHRYSGTQFTEDVWMASYGSFYLVRWPAKASARVMGKRLRAFLDDRIATDSVIPPEPVTSNGLPTAPPPPFLKDYPALARKHSRELKKAPLARKQSTECLKAVENILDSRKSRTGSEPELHFTHISDDEEES